MTIFDYLVLLVIACSVIIGTLRGFVREVLSLASWVVALVVGNAYGEALAEMLPDVIPGESMRLIVAFVVLFIGTRLLMALVSRTLAELIKATGLTLVDRSLGSLFGVARGVVIVLVVVLLCGTTAIPQQAFWTQARLSPWAEQTAMQVMPFLPGKFAEHVHFGAEPAGSGAAEPGVADAPDVPAGSVAPAAPIVHETPDAPDARKQAPEAGQRETGRGAAT